MAQQRINIYGSLVDSADLPTMVSSLFSPGRFTGCEFEVGGVDLLRITPGSALLPDGVLIIEDEPQSLVIDNSSSAADYTIIYQLADSRILGGSPAVLRKTVGISRQSAFTDAVVLGWIRYPGGIPLSAAHFVQPFPLRVSPKTGVYYKSMTPRFADAIRPNSEVPGSRAVQNVEFANLTQTQTRALAFGGQTIRLLGASIMSDVAVKPISVSGSLIADPANYITVTLKKGDITLYTFDSRGTPVGQDYLRAKTPTLMTKAPDLAPDTFIVNSTDSLTLTVTRTGVGVPDTFGSIALSYESPATSGRWSERLEVLSNETVNRWQNISTSPEIYRMSLPFAVAREGQPRKLIARLQVDFNCIMTISVKASGRTLTLSPNNGIISNTGTLITREFDIPVDPTLEWIPSSVASIEIEINAQPGRSAALGQVSLALEPSPFLLFTT